MKKITLLILFTLSSILFFAQEKEIVTEEVENSDVPFSVIEDAPIYPGCKGDRASLMKCFRYSIQKHVARSFNIGLANELGLAAGKKKVYVVFKIDKNGNVVDVRAEAHTKD